MSKRISGISFDVYLDSDLLHVETATLTITDNTAAATTHGVPDGYVDGDVSAEGEMELAIKAVAIIKARAQQNGSWRGIPPLDLLFYAKAGDEEVKVEAFGCKLNLSDLLNIDPKGGAVATRKFKFVVTDPRFINIDGIPYLESEATENLIG
ncbi:phage tail protein [Enterobacter roggenkampii]|uniref:phage protein n=1 Tax=Enterobacter roggenkampii TaxID=1812935 RepID=UPI0007508DE9|nr:phage protein [Enterobacter roggenkampii]KUQ05641.1 phage tail protein [Enterobacter roggenkampii]